MLKRVFAEAPELYTARDIVIPAIEQFEIERHSGTGFIAASERIVDKHHLDDEGMHKERGPDVRLFEELAGLGVRGYEFLPDYLEQCLRKQPEHPRREALTKVAQGLRAGKPILEAMPLSVFGRFVPEMLRLGQECSVSGEACERVAAYLRLEETLVLPQ